MKIQFIALSAVLALLAGCGGGSTTSSTATTSSVSGAVADGYLVNATVFLDKNFNYQFDVGEPSATTDANGAYTLQIDSADIGRYPIVALATQGVTVDLDSGTAVANSYVLSMHATTVIASTSTSVSGTVSNFISPMSSQIRELMETGNYTTPQQAMEALRIQLGLPIGTNMMQNYLATTNTDATIMHTAARNMVALMQSQTSQVMGAGGVATSVDVNRYRAMMGMVYSSLPSINGADAQAYMSTRMGTMSSTLSTIPTGMSFRNMSSAFRGRMMQW